MTPCKFPLATRLMDQQSGSEDGRVVLWRSAHDWYKPVAPLHASQVTAKSRATATRVLMRLKD